MGRSLVPAVTSADDMQLTSAVSRSAAAKDPDEAARAPIYASVSKAFDEVDVLVDYTAHDVVKQHTMLALERGIDVVIGASGLTGADFDEIDSPARARKAEVVAAGEGTLLAIWRVGSRVGLTRGLDTLLLEG